MCCPKPLNGGVEDLAGVGQGGVVDEDTGGSRSAEDPFESLAVAVEILDIGGDRLDLQPLAAQFRGELLECLLARDECAAESLAAEAPDHAGADPGSGA